MIIVLYPDCSTLQAHTRDSLMLLLDRHSQKCVFFITTEKLGWSNLIGDEQPKRTLSYVCDMYVGCMYVVRNHTPRPSVLGDPEPRRTCRYCGP